jgi:hypothetical protein
MLLDHLTDAELTALIQYIEAARQAVSDLLSQPVPAV